MPMFDGELDTRESTMTGHKGSGLEAWHRVETSTASTLQKNPLRCSVLQIKKFRMEFGKGIIIRNKLVYRKKVFANMWDVQNIT